jgi:endonuclease G
MCNATIFAGDPALPKGWPKIDTSYYQNPAGYSWGFDQGHTVPSRDRTRDPKDNLATFLGTNLIPQLPDNNQWFYSPTDPAGASAWYNVEQFVTNLVQSGKEAYVVAGSHGTNQQPQKRSNAREDKFPGETNSAELVKNGINIPTWTWKSILVLDRPGQGSPNVTKDTRVHTFLTPNRAEPSAQDWANAGEQGIMHPFYEIGEKLNLERVLTPIKNVTEWRDPNTWMVSIKELENLLQGKNINLLSNVPESVREELKKRIYSLL